MNEVKKAHEYVALHLSDDIVAYVKELEEDVFHSLIFCLNTLKNLAF